MLLLNVLCKYFISFGFAPFLTDPIWPLIIMQQLGAFSSWTLTSMCILFNFDLKNSQEFCFNILSWTLTSARFKTYPLQVSWCWSWYDHKHSVWCSLPLWVLSYRGCGNSQTRWPHGEFLSCWNCKNLTLWHKSKIKWLMLPTSVDCPGLKICLRCDQWS